MPSGAKPSRSCSSPMTKQTGGGMAAGRNTDQKKTQASATAGSAEGRPTGAAAAMGDVFNVR